MPGSSCGYVLDAYKSVVVPGDSLLLVGIGVRVTLNGSGLATEKTVQVWADLVSLTLLKGVALSASGLEEVGTLLDITWENVSD